MGGKKRVWRPWNGMMRVLGVAIVSFLFRDCFHVSKRPIPSCDLCTYTSSLSLHVRTGNVFILQAKESSMTASPLAQTPNDMFNAPIAEADPEIAEVLNAELSR